MYARFAVMLGIALLFGAGTLLVGSRWSAMQTRRPVAENGEAAPAPTPAATLVVAAVPLRFGTELTARGLREIPWPGDHMPAGAFRSIAEMLGKGRRVALAAMEPNEPVLAGKVTGAGQRGTLSTVLDEAMGAVTVPVNEVVGVGGFVLPGDRVDVFLTRQPRGGDAAVSVQPFTDVVLQNVRVLAVGQVADERADKPSIVNAVTLEVDQTNGQKLSLAAATGSLSLMLRKAGDIAEGPGRRITTSDIGPSTGSASPNTTVRVTRNGKRDEYPVPVAAAVPPRPAVVPDRQLAPAPRRVAAVP